MLVKTSSLEGAALDWAVSQSVKPAGTPDLTPRDYKWFCLPGGNLDEIWKPSANWSQGGPLIDRHVDLMQDESGECGARAWLQGGVVAWGFGPTYLIAAMRAIVAAKLGDTVEVPDELAAS